MKSFILIPSFCFISTAKKLLLWTICILKFTMKFGDVAYESSVGNIFCTKFSGLATSIY